MVDQPKLLVIDDEQSIIEAITGILDSSRFRIETATNGKVGLQQLHRFGPDIVVVDYKMPEINGIEFLKAARSIFSDLPVIVMTAYGDKELSLQFLREGAFRYIEKPFDMDEFRLLLDDCLQHTRLLQENRRLQNIIELNDEFPQIIGESPVMRDLFQLINKVAATDATVLIQGESGTGKELIAKAIHEKSPVKNGPFIRFNCAALPETLVESELFGFEKGAFTGADQTKLGRFELADRGTIFLDEIGELNPAIQVKLLRVLQEKEFERIGSNTTIKTDVRVVAATNRNLKEMVANKQFREDLYYRLSVFPINVPPLRDRQNDVVLIANYFLDRYSKRYQKKIVGFTKDAVRHLQSYRWKGNVRELENVISRAVILCQNPSISEFDLSLEPQGSLESVIAFALEKNLTEEALVKLYAREAYKKCQNNKQKTADFLKINYRTLISRLSDVPENHTQTI